MVPQGKLWQYPKEYRLLLQNSFLANLLGLSGCHFAGPEWQSAGKALTDIKMPL